jgi:uncharacterized protein (DUF3084 family)
MHTVSLLLRILAICSAAACAVFYGIGGNQLKRAETQIEQHNASLRQTTTELEQANEQFKQSRSQLDATVIELASLKRDKRLVDNEVLMVRQELQQINQQLAEITQSRDALISTNETLRRETIELKARAMDPANNSRLLAAQLEEQRSRGRDLEAQLNDAQLVLQRFFVEDRASSTPVAEKRRHGSRVQRVVPEHRLLVLALDDPSHLREFAEIELQQAGRTLARVRVARIQNDLCVVNILSDVDSGIKALQPGARIEYTL